MKIEHIAILISGLSFFISSIGGWIAYRAYTRDTSKLIIKPLLTRPSNSNGSSTDNTFLTIRIINCGRRNDKIKVLVLRAPGYSPTLSYFYYINPAEVANRVIGETEDISISVPLTSFIKEGIQRCREIYLVNSADEVIRASRKSIRKLKRDASHAEAVEIEDKDQWKVLRVKSPSKLFASISGMEYIYNHFNVNEINET
jgi:hypothetical protein